MLFYTITRDFVPPFDKIQCVAIRTWLAAGRALLVGKESPKAPRAVEWARARYHESGIPWFRSAPEQAVKNAMDGEILAYMNCDNAINPDEFSRLWHVVNKMPCFLLVGRRTDVDIEFGDRFDDNSHWRRELAKFAKQNGTLHQAGGVDYFIYKPVDLMLRLLKGKDFVCGHTSYDNFVVARALELGVKVIDITPSVTVAHLNHPVNTDTRRDSPIAKQNRAWADGKIKDSSHAPFVLENFEIRSR